MLRSHTPSTRLTIGSPRQQATAIAPGCIGNFGPGLDILGVAVSGPGDRVTAVRAESAGVTIDDAGHPDLPNDPTKNTAGIAAQEVLRRSGADVGVRLTIVKGLPLAGGQGGSAASAVAAAVATNRLLGGPLDIPGLIESAVEAEAVVSGRHADNVAPQLLGGVVLVRSMDPMDVVQLASPSELRIVLVQPDQKLLTADARSVLPQFIARSVVIRQLGNVAAIVAALESDDLAMLGRAMDDQIAEPARAQLLPGFDEAKAAARAAGALGGSISGAGPTSFWLAGDDVTARRVMDGVRASYSALGIDCAVRVTRIAQAGALDLPEDATTA
ncbi:MAG: homoserine kinase [Gemmatimonadetes bacterium]|nr:homoserine kinase [Gemmatimonadota bacterium]